MSGEQPIDTTPTTPEDGATPEVSPEVTLDDSQVEAMYADWDGELESLESQEFFSNLDKMQPDQIREALKSGYSKVRNNATRALHEKSTKLAHTAKRYESLNATMKEKAELFSQRLDEMQKATEASAESGGVAPEALEALKAGLQTKLDEAANKLKETEAQAAQYFEDNKQLVDAYKRSRWELDQLKNDFQSRMSAFQTNAKSQLDSLTKERDAFRAQVLDASRSVAERAFDEQFPYLSGDAERRGKAMEMYNAGLRRALGMLPEGQQHYPDDQWERIEQVTKAQVMALYPETNPAPAAPPAAEKLAQQPAGTGGGAKPAFQRKNSHIGGIM